MNVMCYILIYPYEVYLSFQSCGRFIPGCGHAGQNIAIVPAFKGSLSSWCPSPLCILLLKSRHWRDALRSCLYRFFCGLNQHSIHINRCLGHILGLGQGTSDLICVEASNSIAVQWSCTPSYLSRSHQALRM